MSEAQVNWRDRIKARVTDHVINHIPASLYRQADLTLQYRTVLVR